MASVMVVEPKPLPNPPATLPAILPDPHSSSDDKDDLYSRLKSLARQLEFIEIQEEYVKDEQKTLKRELLRAQEEVKRIQSVPLVIGQFMEMIDDSSTIYTASAPSSVPCLRSPARFAGALLFGVNSDLDTGLADVDRNALLLFDGYEFTVNSAISRLTMDGVGTLYTVLKSYNSICNYPSKFYKMTVLKRYVLRLFISLKYITANVVDRNNGRIVATASTVEHSLKNTLECGRSCNAKAAAVVGEVLAMRLKVEGLEQGQERGIHVNVNKEIEKKGFKNRTKVWAIVNALKNNGVKLILDDDDDHNGTSPTCY
ncbi:unnamed protein product [Camellia sinensis]